MYAWTPQWNQKKWKTLCINCPILERWCWTRSVGGAPRRSQDIAPGQRGSDGLGNQQLVKLISDERSWTLSRQQSSQEAKVAGGSGDETTLIGVCAHFEVHIIQFSLHMQSGSSQRSLGDSIKFFFHGGKRPLHHDRDKEWKHNFPKKRGNFFCTRKGFSAKYPKRTLFFGVKFFGERRDSKNKVTKTCRKEKIEKKKKKHPPTRKLRKKSEIFVEANREERFPFFYRKLQTAKNTKRKVNAKGGNDSLKKKAHQKREKTQGWKNIRTTMKKAEKKEWRGDFFRGRFYKTFFKKKNQKETIQETKKGFLKTLNKKEVKKMRTRKKRKIGRNWEKKQDLQKVQRERQQRIQ